MIHRTVVTPLQPLRTVVVARGASVSVGASSRPIAVTIVSTGLPGRDGNSGGVQISADAGNQLTTGTDSKLLVPGGYDFEGLVAATLSI